MSKSRSAPAAAPPSRKHLARAAREQRQRRYLLIATAVVAVAVVAIIGFGVFQQTYLHPREAVARVGDQNITLGQFINRTRYQRMLLVQQYQRLANALQFFQSDPQTAAYIQQQQQQVQQALADPATLGRQVIDQMVDDLLIRAEANKRGIAVSPAELDTAYKAIYGYYPNGTPTPTLTPTDVPTDIPPTTNPTVAARLTALPTATASATFTPTTAPSATPSNTPGPTPTRTPVDTSTPTPTPYSTQGFGQVVATQESAVQKQSGISDADLHQLVASQLYRNKLQAVLEAAVPTTADEVHVRHILVTDTVAAQTILLKLKTGSDFVALAAQYSTDIATKDNAGDLGWFAKNELDPALNIAFTMTVGATSDPIPAQSGTGYHIIQVIEHGQHNLSPLALQNARSSALQNWLDAQRAVTMPDNRLLVQIFDNWQSEVPAKPDLSTTQ